MMTNASDTQVRPCNKCGVTERYASGRCAPCRRAQFVQRYARNPEKFRAVSRYGYNKRKNKKFLQEMRFDYVTIMQMAKELV